MPKISVIMPIYNSEKYIRQAANSVINQTFQDFELLAIYDSGTVDKSIEILNEYASFDNRIIPIDMKENKGMVKALNYGIKIAKGDYIARMDSDDISLPNRFEEQLKVLESTDISILGTAVEAFGDISGKDKVTLENSFLKDINKLSKDDVEKTIFSECIVAHPTVMMKKSIFRTLSGYDENFKEAEDYDLWFRALKDGYKFGSICKKMLKYRVHSESKGKQAGSIIEYNIFAKLRYLDLLDYKKDKLKYLIWGASNGGKITHETLNNKLINGEMLGFIDKYKSGYFNDIKIYDPVQIKDLNFDYIFIATTPGKKDAEEYLSKLGYKFINNYAYIL